MWKVAMKQPIVNKAKKVRNQQTNLFGETIGRLHVEKQDIDKMGGKKSKALRKAMQLEKKEERDQTEAELTKEKEELKTEFKQTYGFDESEK